MGRNSAKEKIRKARLRKKKREAEKIQKSRLKYLTEKIEKEDKAKEAENIVKIKNPLPPRPQPCSGILRERMEQQIRNHTEKYGKFGCPEKLTKIINNQHLLPEEREAQRMWEIQCDQIRKKEQRKNLSD